LIPSPIVKVLSTIRKRGVRALLMGGQACILYGAAEFSRDIDLAILADEKNLAKLERALRDLRAEPVYVPPLTAAYLRRGHACHFRAQAPGLEDLRIDVMAALHGCDPFPKLWCRRRRLKLPGAGILNVLSLPDLVRSKKTQRDKDWPMVRRLVEADYHTWPARPSPRQIDFWFREARTADMLIELCAKYPRRARDTAGNRPLLNHALAKDSAVLEAALRTEEDAYRAADRVYWKPLREELFALRQETRTKRRLPPRG
jgi:hypothetical protein